MKAADSSSERIKWYDQLDELYPTLSGGRHAPYTKPDGDDDDITYSTLASSYLTDLFNRTIADVIVFVWNPDRSDLKWALTRTKQARDKMQVGHASLAWRDGDEQVHYASLWRGQPNSDGQRIGYFKPFTDDLEFFWRLPDRVSVVAWKGKQMWGSSAWERSISIPSVTRDFNKLLQSPPVFRVRPGLLSDNCTTFVFRVLGQLGICARSRTNQLKPLGIYQHGGPSIVGRLIFKAFHGARRKVPPPWWLTRDEGSTTPNFLVRRMHETMNAIICTGSEIASLWQATSEIGRDQPAATEIAPLIVDEADGGAESGEVPGGLYWEYHQYDERDGRG